MIGAVLATVLFPFPAVAVHDSGPLCGDHKTLAESLANRYGEVPAAMGFQTGEAVLEVFVSPDTRSWSIVITAPSGRSCMVTTGENWETIKRGPLPRAPMQWLLFGHHEYGVSQRWNIQLGPKPRLDLKALEQGAI